MQPAFVTYITAGYPTVEETVDILLGMEAGGAGPYTPLSPHSAADKSKISLSLAYPSRIQLQTDIQFKSLILFVYPLGIL
jgi:hypothetical protein